MLESLCYFIMYCFAYSCEKYKINATKGRKVVLWLMVWMYRPLWQGRHCGGSLKQLVTLHPQSGSREVWTLVLSSLFLLFNTGPQYMACSTHIYYPIWKTAPQTFSVVCLFVFKLFLDVLQLTTNVSYSNTYICYINSELYI